MAAQEEVREVQAVLERTQAELGRAREDLQAERERRAGDGERFREGLAKVREAAEEALTAEQVTVTQLGSDLRDAQAELETKGAAMEDLRKQLEAAAAARTQAESKAQAEAERCASRWRSWRTTARRPSDCARSSPTGPRRSTPRAPSWRRRMALSTRPGATPSGSSAG